MSIDLFPYYLLYIIYYILLFIRCQLKRIYFLYLRDSYRINLNSIAENCVIYCTKFVGLQVHAIIYPIRV